MNEIHLQLLASSEWKEYFEAAGFREVIVEASGDRVRFRAVKPDAR